jgi:hypothetical protein
MKKIHDLLSKGIRLLLPLFLSLSVHAEVIEAPLLEKMLALQTAQLPNLAKLPQQLNELVKQTQQLQHVQHTLSGDTGIQHLLNGKTEMNQRCWANPEWESLLQAKGSGSYASLSHLQQQYHTRYPVTSEKNIGQTLTDADLIRVYYAQSKAINQTALASSAYSYNQLHGHTQSIQTLLAHLQDTPTEKASVDMNARLLAEVSFIQLEMLRQQTIQNQLLATQAQANVNGLSNEAKFNQWHP